MGIIERSRVYRTIKLERIAKMLLKIGLSANQMTAISLATGIAAVYILFQNHALFIILAITHLVADGLDGVIARYSTSTLFGKYFDAITDASINLLAILKIAYTLKDPYFYIICALFILVYTLYLLSKMNLPILQSRTITLLILTLAPLHFSIPYIAIFTTGFCVFFSAAKMIEVQAPRWFQR